MTGDSSGIFKPEVKNIVNLFCNVDCFYKIIIGFREIICTKCKRPNVEMSGENIKICNFEMQKRI